MTDRLASSSPSTHPRRARTIESTTALEPCTVDGGRLSVELRGAERLERMQVRDFTPDWITVEVSGGWPFERGRIGGKLEVVGLSGFVEQFRCELEFSGWLALSGRVDGEQVGVVRLLLFCERHERPELVRFYRQLRFPALFERAELDASEVMELFERSGYFALRGESRRAQGSQAWCGSSLPAQLSVDAVYCAEDGALLGHVSVTRAYSRTWLGHQLTTFNDHLESAACRVALYHHFATVPILIDGNERQFLLGYYDRGKPWHQLFFDSFIDWYGEPGKATIVAFDRYEAVDSQPPTAAQVGQDDPNVELDQARPDELDEVVALIAEQLPPLALAAFDIDASQLDRAYLHPDFATQGIARGRRVFVLREAGELVGVALCETGREDISLFNLFNMSQLYFRPRATSAAQQGLVAFVRCYYLAHGREQPLIVAPPGSLSEPEEAGLELVETMGCIIWSGPTLRAYRTFLRTAFERVRKHEGKPPTATSAIGADGPGSRPLVASR